MKIITLTISGGVKRSQSFQSAEGVRLPGAGREPQSRVPRRVPLAHGRVPAGGGGGAGGDSPYLADGGGDLR